MWVSQREMGEAILPFFFSCRGKPISGNSPATILQLLCGSRFCNIFNVVVNGSETLHATFLLAPLSTLSSQFSTPHS